MTFHTDRENPTAPRSNLSILIDTFGRLKAQEADIRRKSANETGARGLLRRLRGRVVPLTVSQYDHETLDMEAVRIDAAVHPRTPTSPRFAS
jgi:hypothetical protein